MADKLEDRFENQMEDQLENKLESEQGRTGEPWQPEQSERPGQLGEEVDIYSSDSSLGFEIKPIDSLIQLERLGGVVNYSPPPLYLSFKRKIFAKFRELIECVNRASDLTWEIADYLIATKNTIDEYSYFQVLAEASVEFKISEKTIYNWVLVAEKFPKEKRHNALSFSHHEVVNRKSLNDEQREALLRYAEEKRLSKTELSEIVKKILPSKEVEITYHFEPDWENLCFKYPSMIEISEGKVWLKVKFERYLIGEV